MGDDDAYQDDCCYNLQQSIDMVLKAIAEHHEEQYVENHDVRANLNNMNRMGVDALP